MMQRRHTIRFTLVCAILSTALACGTRSKSTDTDPAPNTQPGSDSTEKTTPPPKAPDPVPTTTPDPPALPPPIPLGPTFSSIAANIFKPKCDVCHTGASVGKDVVLADYTKLLASPRDLVLPGNVDESSLVIAIKRKDDKQMPPAPQDHLSQLEFDAITGWIDAGALDN